MEEGIGELVTQLGAGAVFVLIVLKLYIDYAKGKKRPNDLEFMEKVEKIRVDVADLRKWHDKEDVDGVKVWYFRASLEAAIIKLSESIAQSTRINERMLDKLDNIESKLSND